MIIAATLVPLPFGAVAGAIVAEDGTTAYVAEDGSTPYVQD